MSEKPLICVDADIPFLDGRLEPFARVRLLGQEEFTPEAVRDADALMIRTRTRCAEPLLGGSRVRMIATATIGMDQFDLPWCAARGIETRNAPGCNAPAVAQYVWGCILHLGYKPEGLTVGVVGCGHVGSIVADWARRLGARVLVSDPPLQAAGTRPDLEYRPLRELASSCDVLTVHTPHTSTGDHPTHHLVDALGELLTAAARSGSGELVVQVGYFEHQEEEVRSIVDQVQAMEAPEQKEPWTVNFYPEGGDVGIIEILLKKS